MSVTSNLVLSPQLGLAAGGSDSERLHAAAQQFEAIFLRQMLAAARKSSFDEDGLLSGEGLATFRQMQDEHFADVAAKSGALGLATVIEAQMARYLPPASESEG